MVRKKTKKNPSMLGTSKKPSWVGKTQIGAAFLQGDFSPAGGSLALPLYVPPWSWAAP
jgi:hypothetical protein